MFFLSNHQIELYPSWKYGTLGFRSSIVLSYPQIRLFLIYRLDYRLCLSTSLPTNLFLFDKMLHVVIKIKGNSEDDFVYSIISMQTANRKMYQPLSGRHLFTQYKSLLG